MPFAKIFFWGCLLPLSTACCMEGEKNCEKQPRFSYLSLEERAFQISRSQDVVVLKNGALIPGNFVSLPDMIYSFGSVSPVLEEIIFFFQDEKQKDKWRLLTSTGRHYLAPFSERELVIREENSNEPTKIPLSEVDFVSLHPRKKKNKPQAYQLTLKNGDEIPVDFSDRRIYLVKNQIKQGINTSDIIDLSFSGGLQGNIRNEKGKIINIGLSFAENPYIALKIPNQKPILRLPWSQVAFLDSAIQNIEKPKFESKQTHEEMQGWLDKYDAFEVTKIEFEFKAKPFLANIILDIPEIEFEDHQSPKVLVLDIPEIEPESQESPQVLVFDASEIEPEIESEILESPQALELDTSEIELESQEGPQVLVFDASEIEPEIESEILESPQALELDTSEIELESQEGPQVLAFDASEIEPEIESEILESPQALELDTSDIELESQEGPQVLVFDASEIEPEIEPEILKSPQAFGPDTSEIELETPEAQITETKRTKFKDKSFEEIVALAKDIVISKKKKKAEKEPVEVAPSEIFNVPSEEKSPEESFWSEMVSFIENDCVGELSPELLTEEVEPLQSEMEFSPEESPSSPDIVSFIENDDVEDSSGELLLQEEIESPQSEEEFSEDLKALMPGESLSSPEIVSTNENDGVEGISQEYLLGDAVEQPQSEEKFLEDSEPIMSEEEDSYSSDLFSETVVGISEPLIESPSQDFLMDKAGNLFIPGSSTKDLGFYIARKKVTNAEYKNFLRSIGYKCPSHWINGQIPEGQEERPVVNITYKDILLFSVWSGKRLPTLEELDRAWKLEGGLIDKNDGIKEWTSSSNRLDEEILDNPKLLSARMGENGSSGYAIYGSEDLDFLDNGEFNPYTGFRLISNLAD